ncbi:MAG: FtsX-like permease family protein, partial [Candidatus Pacebacteria bacterium]|nr:FtsX-like permease family protein [Candidatus Paceibacterota bacterium]
VNDGRGFNLENQSGDFAENNVVVNEKFVKDFDLNNPVGKTVYMDDTLALQIIGVSNDVYLYGAWAPVDPLIYRLAQEEDFGRIVIRTASQNLSEVNEMLKKEWAELVPNYPYEGQYQKELLKAITDVNNSLNIMFAFLAACALLLSVLGLYSLVSLSVLNRTKEVGIRKVHGASVKRIMLIISKPFTLLIVGAIVFGSVGGYFFAMMTLGSIYKMHMTPNAISFIIPILVIVLTSIITIIWRVYKAASQNPANSLRYE